MADEDESVKVVCGEDPRDCETGSLPVKRGTGYSIANWEYLTGGLIAGKDTGK